MTALTVPGAGPLYLQIRQLLTRRISSGHWVPGQLIPSEQRLAGELGVSQGTVRKAVDELVNNNLLVRQQGKGTFVSTHEQRRALFHFLNIAGEDARRAMPESRVLSCRRLRATRGESAALELASPARVIRIERVRLFHERPTIAETIVLDAARFPGLDSGSVNGLPNALYALYESTFGVTIHRADEKLRAVPASPRDARLLAVKPGDPVLEVERIARTVDGRPVELRISHLDTRHYHYQSSVL